MVYVVSIVVTIWVKEFLTLLAGCILCGHKTNEEIKQDLCIYRVSQEESARLRESVPYVKLYRYNPKHLYPKLNGYGDNDQSSLKL